MLKVVNNNRNQTLKNNIKQNRKHKFKVRIEISFFIKDNKIKILYDLKLNQKAY